MSLRSYYRVGIGSIPQSGCHTILYNVAPSLYDPAKPTETHRSQLPNSGNPFFPRISPATDSHVHKLTSSINLTTMSVTDTSLRVLRLLPVITSTAVLMFAVDEHIFLGTWMAPPFRERANMHLPSWFQLWGRRGRWVILLGYPGTYVLGMLNLLVARPQLKVAGAQKWYALGLLCSVGHIAIYGKRALKLLAEIKGDVPKGNSTCSMAAWLRMHRIRTCTTDVPALVFFVVGALKVL
ncbi:hypothetical protein BHYA_0018g00060 [Botrytis hyacinthi]|uniref:Uncharacterized protein n=1 Tax=Botrytis hyacinthi TaxID=278943 RepID=A0A4Z1GYK1_9HELO|nr:hypothetical protein BHYA_0018g00060 [Botrytis hyacinthi]